MNDKGFLAGIVAVGIIVVIALVVLVKPTEQSYGGTTNLDSLTLSGTLTAATIANSGTVTAADVAVTDDLTVTDDASVAGNVIQLGSDDVTTYIYVGTTDGCGAWIFSASGTTPTLTATSSAFCN